MTPQEYSQRLTKLYGLVSGDLAKDTILISGAELLIQIKQRVAVKGKGTDENNIGDYSTEPIYASRNQFINGSGFNPQGKNNKEGNTIGDRIIPSVRLKTTSVKKNPVKYSKYTLVKPNLTERKKMYLKDGYKELRGIQDLETGFINLNYSGRMSRDYILKPVGQSVLLGIATDRSAEIYEGLSNRFGLFFVASEKEKEQYINRSNGLFERITRNTIAGYDITPTIN